MISSGYLMIIPDELLVKVLVNVKDVFKDYDDVVVFRPNTFKDFYKDFFDECSVAGASEDADGCLGQG